MNYLYTNIRCWIFGHVAKKTFVVAITTGSEKWVFDFMPNLRIWLLAESFICIASGHL